MLHTPIKTQSCPHLIICVAQYHQKVVNSIPFKTPTPNKPLQTLRRLPLELKIMIHGQLSLYNGGNVDY